MARMFVLFACLSVWLLVVDAACPNACNSNGVCISDKCQCEGDWTGDDCSISDILATSGVALTEQSVPTRQFRFFHLNLLVDGAVIIDVSQTSEGGDIDSYARIGERPTRNDFDVRDITRDRDIQLVLPDATGVVYVGLYGYVSATATITITVHSTCPNDCSDAGLCSASGYCECYEGHAGEDCSIDIVKLDNEQTITGRVEQGEWQYFDAEYSTVAHDAVQFVVRQALPYPENDCNLYVKYFWLPHLNFYDFRDVSSSSEYKVGIASPQTGHYYAGVYGNTVCDFNITLYLKAPGCPNRCSGTQHGTCDEITYECECNQDFAGESCNTMIPAIGFNMPVEGFSAGNSWNYYTLNTFSSANALVSMVQSDEDGQDCDVYVAQDRNPTFFDYDFRDITYRSSFDVLVTSSNLATWKIGVHGYAHCNYTMVVTMVLSCLNDCTDPYHGTCVDGTCACKEGYSGGDCSSSLNRLGNGADIVDTVVSGEWQYYLFTAEAGTRATVYLKESLSTGYVWLYANPAHAGNPTLSNHEVADTETKNGVHIISISAVSRTSYIIGAHGNALSVPGSNLEFSLVAYQPLF